jgi:hypothetical protein
MQVPLANVWTERSGGLQVRSEALGCPAISESGSSVLKARRYRKGAGIIVRGSIDANIEQSAGDEEGICATRIISKMTGRSTKLAVW